MIGPLEQMREQFRAAAAREIAAARPVSASGHVHELRAVRVCSSCRWSTLSRYSDCLMCGGPLQVERQWTKAAIDG